MAESTRSLNVLLGPAGSTGDVHPFIAIGQALKARGHDVTLITSPYFRDVIERAGLPFYPVGTAEYFEQGLRNPEMWHRRRGFPALIDHVMPLVREAYDAVVHHHEPGRTVLACQVLAFGGRIAAEKHRIPMATVHLQPAVFWSAHQPPESLVRVPGWFPAPLNRLLGRLFDLAGDRLLAPRLNRIRAELDLPPVRRILSGWLSSPDRIIAMFPDWFAPCQPDWPSQTVLTGFPLYDEGDLTPMPDGAAEFLAEDDPPIVFTPGSAQMFGERFFAAAVEACERLGRRGVLLTRHTHHVPRNLPPNVRHFDYVPFGELLPRSSALVYHGGIGTLSQGLAAGLPHLVMPMGFDQPDNAARLRRLGVGKALAPRRFTGEAVTRELERLLGSTAVRERCAELRGRLRGVDAVTPTCELIEALA